MHTYIQQARLVHIERPWATFMRIQRASGGCRSGSRVQCKGFRARVSRAVPYTNLRCIVMRYLCIKSDRSHVCLTSLCCPCAVFCLCSHVCMHGGRKCVDMDDFSRHGHIHVYTCIHQCVYICVCVYVCMYVSLHVCVCVYAGYVCVCMYIYTHTHMHVHKQVHAKLYTKVQKKHVKIQWEHAEMPKADYSLSCLLTSYIEYMTCWVVSPPLVGCACSCCFFLDPH